MGDEIVEHLIVAELEEGEADDDSAGFEAASDLDDELLSPGWRTIVMALLVGGISGPKLKPERIANDRTLMAWERTFPWGGRLTGNMSGVELVVGGSSPR